MHGGAAVLTRTSPILVGKYELVTTTDRLLWWEDQIRRQGICAFDTETTGLDPHTAELVGIALALRSGEACYVPVGHQGVEQLPLPTVLNVLGPANHPGSTQSSFSSGCREWVCGGHCAPKNSATTTSIW